MGRNLIAKLLNTARLRIQAHGEFLPDMFEDIVDETIDEFMRDGLITDDANIEVIKREVVGRLREGVGK